MPKFQIVFDIMENLTELWPTFTVGMNFKKVTQLCDRLPSTEWRKWHPRMIYGKSPVNL